MKKNRIKFIVVNLIAIICIESFAGPGGPADFTVQAGSISDIQDRIREREELLESIYGKIGDLEDELDIRQEEIDDLNSEIINTMASIGIKEDEIAAKELEIQDKERQIELTEGEYDAAVKREEDQRLSMAASTRLLYEQGETSYLDAILKGHGLSDILNRMEYIEKIYEYSKARLEMYMETKEQVLQLWNRLEEEKTGMEADRQQLEADKAELQDLKDNLDVQLTRKKQESANFEEEISRARKEASAAKKLLQQDQQKLKELEAAQRAARNAANITYATTDYTTIIDGSSGSDLGKKIAKYGCQFIGNPYVNGGTDLVKGADCSGFTYRIYQDFGYSLPRTSYQQRSSGTGVTYDQAQPGDLICYDGHVAIYIGGGLIVHASNSRTGIKVGKAQYKTILAVRRII